ncbi:hypothetical protein N7520_010879 [Penicillium odoratum]|uniref:uncharacterized protein n=1 Tax=Penicillium odoratum TaxID=1167516 RepID=UPI002547AA12|nr:uncharacterized protein N7520_010879 [Penicillium odoratum]KAJ5745697.1 hypothetical protein N7520_010879 [Penicillium odoratum]
MFHFVISTDSSIVMAEQSSRDVVDQTLSGGEPSPSDVPASTTDKTSAEGDAGETKHIANTSQTQVTSEQHSNDVTRDTRESQDKRTGGDKDTGSSSMVGFVDGKEENNQLKWLQDASKQGVGLVASRALELNGQASVSDGGDDTGSQGGSESDTSRTDGRHHTRTGSVKKPSIFKPMSFAKFTVPKAPGAPAPPKAPEKVPSASTTPLGTPQPSSRPRLVAKTTSGMRDSISKTGAGGGKPGGSGPDPNQVWNKNRPVQPPPQKHLTDEELKQQYGIHMTSRIQEDSGGTESKWADIDDDEDDWAPETIEWTDGTKVTLTHNDHPPPPEEIAQLPKEAPPPEQPVAAQEAPRIAAPKPTTSVGPNPTVLRLGASAERQAKAASISSRGTNDRMPSGSTSPAPPPAKSPWAALPPVERVSPVNPPLQPPPVSQPRGQVGYPHREDGHHTALPPQEIAADDFNRTWRETTSGAPRELYNSRSGRYEPVADNRRPSWRQDQGPRPPAVLQRPNHGEHAGPAEPSAAFQTSRSSHQEGMGWNRRRTSSNVSGGSGSYGRRMSFGRDAPPPRYNDARRGSHANNMVDPALLGREPGHVRETSPNRQQAGSGLPARPSVSMGSEPSPKENQPAPVVVPEVPQEDPLVLQERIMKEKRLEARQRRLEQEEQEKQAREERIRQKLAALGPPPEKKRKDSIDSRKPQAPTSNAPPAALISSPPKPPVPEPTGAPKQYGMMKVHHPDSVKRIVAANERDRVAEKQTEKTSSPHLRRAPSPHHDSSQHEPAPPSINPPSAESHPHDPKVDEQDGQQRNLNVSNSYAPWSTAPNLPSNPPSVNNLWKSLSSDRTLGNGIFDPSLGGFPSRDIPLRSQLGLDQPTMPAGQSFPPQDAAPIPSLPSPETRHVSYDPLSPIGRPGPIGPPSSQNPQWQNERVNAWNNFGLVANKHELEAGDKFRQEFKETQKLREIHQSNRDQPGKQSNIKHTWRKVVIGEDGVRRTVSVTTNDSSAPKAPAQPPLKPAAEPVVETAVETPAGHTWKQVRVEDGVRRQVAVHANHNSKPAPAPPSNPLNSLETPTDGLSFADSHARSLANVPARSSRFFPNVTEQPRRIAVEQVEVHRSPSPPPPEEYSHPVHDNGSGRPMVHFPPARPIVKLPPKPLAAAPAPPRTFASMAAAPPRTTPAPASTSPAMSWQDKINGLFGKKTSPEKKSVLAVASATKEPLDVQLSASAVSVSLPSHVEVEVNVQNGDGDLAARQVAEEEAIFEDREPGSQPGVRVPLMAPPAAWHSPALAPIARTRFKHMKPVGVQSIEVYMVGSGDKDQYGNTRIPVLFPGQETGQTLLMLRKNRSNQQRPRHPSNPKNTRKGPKPRDGSGSGGSTWNKKPSSSQQNNAPASSPRHPSRNATWGPRDQSGSQ